MSPLSQVGPYLKLQQHTNRQRLRISLSVTTVGRLEDAIRNGKPAITDDPMLLCQVEGIDAIIEATGEVEFGVNVVLCAINHGKHVILMNAELDAVVGPIRKEYADKAGGVITNVDGDQPGRCHESDPLG
jgi:predicted homoserine dehydrogenase-like protein